MTTLVTPMANDLPVEDATYVVPPPVPPAPYHPLTLPDLLAMEIPPRRMLLDPVLPEKGLAMLYAPRGMGKTYLALAMAHAVATGGGILRWRATAPHSVLYIDGEMPLSLLQERMAAIVGAGQPPETFRLLAADHHDGGLLNLATPAGQQAIEPLLGGVSLLVLDNISTLASAARDNDAESWSPVQEWILRLRRQGMSVLFVHHAGKGGQQRGTSRREDVLDTVIALRKPTDSKPADGARFEVHYEKARGLFGNAAKPFEASLEIVDGVATWIVDALVDTERDKIGGLIGQGLPVRKVAELTGVSKSKVQRAKKAAAANGHATMAGAD